MREFGYRLGILLAKPTVFVLWHGSGLIPGGRDRLMRWAFRDLDSPVCWRRAGE